MIKKTITYTDYDGNDRTEDFYFNLTKAEVMEMEMMTDGGLQKMIEKIIQTSDTKKIIEIFKGIILKSYGEKSPDGRRFIKNDELRDAFSQTEAYSQLFMELATDAKAATDFVNGVIPQIDSVPKPASDTNSQNIIPMK
jgi:hypothetical protein